MLIVVNNLLSFPFILIIIIIIDNLIINNLILSSIPLQLVRPKLFHIQIQRL
jgi:hypothetical protein